jgi:hypothetical protein
VQTGGNGWFLVSRLKEEIAAGMAASAAAAASSQGGSAAPDKASASAPPGITEQQQQQQQQQQWWGRRVSEGAFRVLQDMLEAVVSTAAVQEDWRVVVAALQIAQCITCTTGCGRGRLVLVGAAALPDTYR